ncbi:MAG: hypothetical protein GY796_04405 [Chloroflexi bacterium]|nr:hypothetical protein [Chloroflexota bacterium]
MIEWTNVFFNSLWILGLAIILATISYTYWEAQERETSFRKLLGRPMFEIWFWISAFFITLGLAGTSKAVWETVVWIIFTLISAVNIYKTATQMRMG